MPIGFKPKSLLFLTAVVWQTGCYAAPAAEPIGEPTAGKLSKGLVGTVEQSTSDSGKVEGNLKVSESNAKDMAPDTVPTLADMSAKVEKDSERNLGDSLLTGYRFMKSCSYAKALDAFNVAARENPASAEPHFGRALALIGLSRREEALKEFKLTMLLDPSSRMAHKCQREIDFGGLQKIDHSNQPRNITTTDLERTTSEITNCAAKEIQRIQADTLRRAESMRKMDRQAISPYSGGGTRYSRYSRYSGDSRYSRYSRHSNSRHSNYSSGSTSGGRSSGFASRDSDSAIRARALSQDVRLRGEALRDSATGLNSSMSSRPSESSGVYLTPHGTNLGLVPSLVEKFGDPLQD
ncbi:MAG: hypothetical protein SGJ27_17140 [Candidatus Melainabacteria bacterium]|nr:hypothetical protein [Candidatus Melainabacteria bacterium]